MKRIFRYDHATNKVIEVTGTAAAERTQNIRAAYDSSTPLVSQSLGCHPDQVPEYREELRRSGVVGAEVTPSGTVEFTCPRGRQGAMKFNKGHDKNGYGGRY